VGNLERVFYVGEFSHSLDDKGRLTIPAKWRFSGDQDDVYLALPNTGGFITVFPPRMMARFEEQVSKISLGDPEGQATLMQLGSMADTFGCDKQGRISISDRLVRHAGLGKQAVLVGNFTYFSIHSPERYESGKTEDPELINKILTKINV